MKYCESKNKDSNDWKIQHEKNEMSFSDLKNAAGVDACKSWWNELPKLYPNNPTNILTYPIANQGVLHFTQVGKFE